MRRGAVVGVIVGCAALAACLMAFLWRGDARTGSLHAGAQPQNSAAAQAAAGAQGADTAQNPAPVPDAQPEVKTLAQVEAEATRAGLNDQAIVTGVVATDLTVPGPAAAHQSDQASKAITDGINRIGSAEISVRRYDPVGTGTGTGTGTNATTETHIEPWAVLVWAHGGSFVRGGLNTPESDWVARQFAAAGIRVYAVDYALATDSVKAPAPANDVAAVAAWVSNAETAPLLIGGASAGAHLAALAALDRADAAAAGDSKAAAALLLEYPTLHRVQRPDTAIANATAQLRKGLRFDPDRIADMYAFHLGAVSDAEAAKRELVAGEIAPDRLALLPSTVIVNADLDDLRASGEQFADQLAIAGVRVLEYTQQGTTHGYMNRSTESTTTLASAQQSIDRFVQGARSLLN